jgi:putative transcriptional regulator
MKKAHFDELPESVREAGRIRRGEAKPPRVFSFTPTDVKAIRARLGKSQSQCALVIGVSTLQNWEQGRRRPEGPAQALLRVAAAAPHIVAKALSQRKRRAHPDPAWSGRRFARR